MRSLPHSKHNGRGVQTQLRQSWQRCKTSFCCAAASQKGLASVVIPGNGLRMSNSAIGLSFVSQDGHGAAAEIFAVGENAQSRNQTNLCVRDLSIAAFTTQLPYPLQDMKSSARCGWLAAIDHSAAGLNRQLSF